MKKVWVITVFAAVLIGITLIVGTHVLSISHGVDKLKTVKNNLRFIQGKIDVELIEYRRKRQELSPGKFLISLQKIAENDPGFRKALRCWMDPNVTAAINPDTEAWLNPERHEGEVAVYFPVLLTGTEEKFYVGIDFRGNCIFLKTLPEYDPLSIESLLNS